MTPRTIRVLAAAVSLLAAAQVARADDDEYPRPCNQSEANAVATLEYWSHCDQYYPTYNCATIEGCTAYGPDDYEPFGTQCIYDEQCLPYPEL